MTVVVAAIHHRRHPDGHGPFPFPFPFPFRSALEPWKPYDVVCVCDRRRERREAIVRDAVWGGGRFK